MTRQCVPPAKHLQNMRRFHMYSGSCPACIDRRRAASLSFGKHEKAFPLATRTSMKLFAFLRRDLSGRVQQQRAWWLHRRPSFHPLVVYSNIPKNTSIIDSHVAGDSSSSSLWVIIYCLQQTIIRLNLLLVFRRSSSFRTLRAASGRINDSRRWLTDKLYAKFDVCRGLWREA